jgi:hypothetical protein
MNKGGNPYFDKVVKSSIYNGMMNFDYENAVNRQRNREDKVGDFKAEQTWGEKETLALVKKDGVAYLQFKLQKKLEVRYFDKFNGTPIDESQLENYLPKKNGNAKQELDKEVIVLRPKLENIRAISIKGGEYLVRR